MLPLKAVTSPSVVLTSHTASKQLTKKRNIRMGGLFDMLTGKGGEGTPKVNASSIYELPNGTDVDGNEFDYSSLKGKVVLITNGLVALEKKYKTEGLEILLFPSGQFGGQELANNADIKKFAREKGFNGTVMAKGDVEGANATPMWSYCLDKFPGGVGWNFKAKFIVDREGNVVNRNSSSAQDQEALIKPLL
ncbi:glutathione peroxidase [Bathycoccus prasinos]|uniref:Glutathione peroxidase n=1 Tax=Bathycoccus prasinos TaxID=41875 RepID=K8EJE6_9CHLO|nr:glutathione peroxidase [Bathycoccus prasinos]CCO18317.1 glutathione peroxidase [Bathycoccus prasinos]|eukprot:XP_007510784.1 glutathione peroxidase [Bathycoccus prasinos]